MAKSLDERVRELLSQLLMENLALATRVEQLQEEKTVLEDMVARLQITSPE